MELYEAIRTRRSIRQFTDEKIPQNTLKRIVEAAYNAPANDHFRDWHYIVLAISESKSVIAKIFSIFFPLTL